MRPFPGAASFRSSSPRLPDKSHFRSRASAIAVATVFGLPATGYALGLGGIVGESILGEALQLEVPLTGTLDGALDNNCVSLRRPADPIDPEYFPRDMVARVDKQSGSLRLLLTTRSAIRQPLLQFGVSITCGYNLSRDYLIAVSPRERAPATQPDAQPGTQAVARAVASPQGPTSIHAATPDGVAGKSIVLDREMTLEQLARQRFPGPLRQERFMRWVVEANPQYFANAGDLRQYRLATGTQLLIPDGVPPRRAGDHQNGSSPLDQIGKAAAPKTAVADATTKPKATAKAVAKRGQDRLVVGSGGGVKDYKEAVALVQRLTGMMEQQVTAQAANEERIRQLEAGAADLKNRIAQVEADARQREAQIEAQLQAAKQAQDELAERAWWQVAVAVLVGGALGAALLQGYRMLTARRQEPELPSFGTPPHKTADAAGSKAKPAAAPARAGGRLPARATEAPAAPRAAGPAALRSAPSAQARKPKADKDPLDFEPPSFLQTESRRVTTAQTATAVADVAVQEVPDPAKAAIELANIMTSMGLTESAAQTLVDHIRENPRQSLQHWLKLLELHRINGKREDFERSTQELRQHFNVRVEEWGSAAGASRGSIETYPHVRAQITKLWHDPGCVKYLHSLLMDNREGTRAGFPLSVAEEILLLIAVQSDTQ
jgi:pilus assembly protein FimV